MNSEYNISVVNLMARVVDSMRTTGVITGFVQDGDQVIIESVNSLKENEIITIAGQDYIVYNPGPANFKIYFNGQFDAEAWTTKAPYFMHGHFLEIANRLTNLDQSEPVHQFQKYPLIALIQDFPEERENGQISVKLRVIIMAISDQNYNSEQRYTNVIVPILYPLYGQFMKALKNSRLFSGPMSHTKTDRIFWGTQLAMYNNKPVMNDYIDAVELENLDLTVIRTCN